MLAWTLPSRNSRLFRSSSQPTTAPPASAHPPRRPPLPRSLSARRFLRLALLLPVLSSITTLDDGGISISASSLPADCPPGQLIRSSRLCFVRLAGQVGEVTWDRRCLSTTISPSFLHSKDHLRHGKRHTGSGRTSRHQLWCTFNETSDRRHNQALKAKRTSS